MIVKRLRVLLNDFNAENKTVEKNSQNDFPGHQTVIDAI